MLEIRPKAASDNLIIRESLPILTLAEWEIMNVCWQASHRTVQEIIEGTDRVDKKHYQTMKKQIEGLVQKGYLTREKMGKLCFYSPKYSKRPVVIREVKHFIESIAATELSETYIDLIVSKSFRSDEILKTMNFILNMLVTSHKAVENNEEIEKREET